MALIINPLTILLFICNKISALFVVISLPGHYWSEVEAKLADNTTLEVRPFHPQILIYYTGNISEDEYIYIRVNSKKGERNLDHNNFT